MFDNLKIPIDKLLYEKVNDFGLLLYLGILTPFLLVFICILNNEDLSYLYSPLVILLSVSVIFIQMNYNIYDSKLKKEEELKLKTLEILERKYLNVILFDDEEKKLLITDGDYSLNKLVVKENSFSPILKNKLLKQYNLLEYLLSLVNNKLLSKEMFFHLMDEEIKFWMRRLQLLKIISGQTPKNLIEYGLKNKFIDESYLDRIKT